MPTPDAFVTLYQDDALLAVDKPAGVTVIPARDEPPEAALRLRLEATRGERLWVVHRVDRDTSGVVVFARDAASHRALSTAFEARTVRKTYVAFTRGMPPGHNGAITTPLHAARKGKMRPAQPGEDGALACETGYVVTGTWPTALGPVAELEVTPRTGRQHQIRVHLRSVEAALLVDPLYGRCARVATDDLGPGAPAVERLTLHAAGLVVPHPRDGRDVRIASPLPPDLAALRAWLRARDAQS